MKLTCYAEVWPPFNTIRPLNIEEHGDLVRNRRAVMVRLKGLSHGLKTVHRTVFLTAFRVPYNTKETDTRWVSVSLVRLKGLEPTRLATREPKSRMSTNSITGAYSNCTLLFYHRLWRSAMAFSPFLVLSIIIKLVIFIDPHSRYTVAC